ncbi:MAG: hypothetical protein ACPHID_01285 [Thermoplasmatota archaeon]
MENWIATTIAAAFCMIALAGCASSPPAELEIAAPKDLQDPLQYPLIRAEYHSETDEGKRILTVTTHPPRAILLQDGNTRLAGYIEVQTRMEGQESLNQVHRIFINETYHVILVEQTCLSYDETNTFCQFSSLNWVPQGALAPFGFGWLSLASDEAPRSYLGNEVTEIEVQVDNPRFTLEAGPWSSKAVEAMAVVPGEWQLDDSGWVASRIPGLGYLPDSNVQLVSLDQEGTALHSPHFMMPAIPSLLETDHFPGHDRAVLGSEWSVQEAIDELDADDQRRIEMESRCLVQMAYLYNSGGGQMGVGGVDAYRNERTSMRIIFGAPDQENVGWDISRSNNSVLGFRGEPEFTVNDLEARDVAGGVRDCEAPALMLGIEAAFSMVADVLPSDYELRDNLSSYSFTSFLETKGAHLDNFWYYPKFFYQFNRPKHSGGGALTFDDTFVVDAEKGVLATITADAKVISSLH